MPFNQQQVLDLMREYYVVNKMPLGYKLVTKGSLVPGAPNYEFVPKPVFLSNSLGKSPIGVLYKGERNLENLDVNQIDIAELAGEMKKNNIISEDVKLDFLTELELAHRAAVGFSDDTDQANKFIHGYLILISIAWGLTYTPNYSL